MKKILTIALVHLWAFAVTLEGQEVIPANAEVYFSPSGGCTDAIVRTIAAARETVYVQAYSFTSALIAKALIDAHKRGVVVEVILDKDQNKERYSVATTLTNASIPTYADPKHSIAHDKVMIVDRRIVITGSFNFTKNAEERNGENLLILYSHELADAYFHNWEKHRTHSSPYGQLKE